MMTMKQTLTTAISAVAAITLAACASTVPKELEEARVTYDRAESGPASEHAMAELHEARTALKQAEDAFDDEGDEPVTRDRAYIATRRAQLADTVAQIRIQSQRIAQAMEERDALESQIRQETTRELSQTRDALQSERQALEQQRRETQAERQARQQAEARAREATRALEQYVEVHQEQRGMVITLASGAMFATGKAELRSEAKDKVDRVADYLLAHPEQTIVIEGHTDDRGSASFNEQLSRQRAQSVRDYLVDKGVPATQMRVMAYGEERPVASNETSEGRATNRRVEIVLEPLEEDISPRGSEGEGTAPSPEDAPTEPSEEEWEE